MAVHRKRPVPRTPVFGKRLRRPVICLSTVLVLMGASLVAYAQEGGSLSAGAASFEAGKYDAAARQFTSALNGGNLEPNEAAKALFYRGLAYQRLKQPARAIADLGAAIWLGLSGSDKVSATVNRGLAYQAAGLSEQAEEDFSAARKLGGRDAVEKLLAASGASSQETAGAGALATEVRPGSAPSPAAGTGPGSGFNTAMASAQTPAAARNDASDSGGWTTTDDSAGESRLSRWWGSVREGVGSLRPGSGSSESAQAEPASAEPAPAAPPKTASAEPKPFGGSGVERTQPNASSASAPSVEVPPPMESSPESSSGESRISRWWGSVREGVSSLRPGSSEEASAETAGASATGYRLQLTPTRSESEARDLWQTVSAQNPNLAGQSHRIERTSMGDLGTFYRLQIGPFQDKAESTKLCNALKRSGVDCFLVAP
jgi:hypothetical protein